MIFIPVQIIYAAQLLKSLHTVWLRHLFEWHSMSLASFPEETWQFRHCFWSRWTRHQLSFYYPKSYNLNSLTPFRFYLFHLPIMCLWRSETFVGKEKRTANKTILNLVSDFSIPDILNSTFNFNLMTAFEMISFTRHCAANSLKSSLLALIHFNSYCMNQGHSALVWAVTPCSREKAQWFCYTVTTVNAVTFL